MTIRTAIFAALALLSLCAVAAQPMLAQQISDVAPYLMADRAEEIALARSAAPKHVSDFATVLVLTGKGFVEGARGTNGFTCLVVRSFDTDLSDPTFWNPRARAPHCLNPPAVRSVLPEILKRAEWVLSGVSLSEIGTRTASAYNSGAFPMPAVGAMAYMLSPHQYLSDSNPHWLPHLMFYFDRSLPAATWGADAMTEPVIDGSAGDMQSPVRVLFVPVRQWSDGTPAIGSKPHPKTTP